MGRYRTRKEKEQERERARDWGEIISKSERVEKEELSAALSHRKKKIKR